MQPTMLGLIVAILGLLSAPVLAAGQPASDLVARGEYLARAGDCFSCHTKAGGTPMAGGRQIETPYGSIASPNITPDRDTGIGTWTDANFIKLMHDGIDDSGNYVYPVMPFDHYTKVTTADLLALKAFLFSLPPVHSPRPASHLAFPFSVRTSLAAWRALFFTAGTYESDPALSPAQNRGAYLVEGLGHCGACHTPRDALSGSEHQDSLGGGEIAGQGWFAPNISSDLREGIGGWSEQQLVDYLGTGVAQGKAIAAGPMAEVVQSSLRYLTPEDLHAVAAYLKGSPGKALYAERHLVAPAGATAYLDNCAFCHLPDGKGVAGAVPPLVGNGVVLAGGPEDLIRTILGGVPASGPYAPMPGMATMRSSQRIADIANYVRTSWGNAAPTTATAGMVEDLGKKTATMLAGTGGCDPVRPAPLAAALARPEVVALLRDVTADNMQQKIAAILPLLPPASGTDGQADLVNGLTAAYCPLVNTTPGITGEPRVEQLQRFAMLVYVGLSNAHAAPGVPGQD